MTRVTRPRQEATITAVPSPKRHPYDQWSPDARALDLVGDKWTLLIVRDLVCGPRRFVELQRVLPGISTEQLRSRLNRMVADGLLTRQRYREVPPRVDYELTDRARDLVPVIAELSRWGYRWAWGRPRPREAVDVGAVLRAACGLCDRGPGPEGVVELRVDDRRFWLTLDERGASLSEEAPADEPDAVIAGGEEDWIAALGPEATTDRLVADGGPALVERALSAFAPGPASGRAAEHVA
ncbi:MAG TPA: helix-turn-helix domain-containing protein [Capillimicrobium sp.]|nr:helix-turn-helix domain-containing protein [Capillimicrobium sp.]